MFRLRWSVAVAVGLLCLGATGLLPGAPAPAGHALGIATASDPASCVVPLLGSGVHGQITVDGGPLAGEPMAGWVLNYTFTVAFRQIYASNGTLVDNGCLTDGGNTTVAPNGSFSFTPVSPQGYCTGTVADQVCTEYSVPFAPVNVTLEGGAPLGYAVSVAGWYASIAVALVYELAAVTITPGGPTVTTSVGAPTEFAAAASTADGSPTPLPTTFLWSLVGTGSFDGPATGPSVAVSAVSATSVATLTVRANASVPGGRLAPVNASVEAIAIPTEIETGQTNRTSLDAGGSLEVRLSAYGAAGYPYSAFVDPGLGLPGVRAPCTVGPPTGGTVAVSCEANVSYPSAGTAQPTANVSNGYSAADWRFPNVVVSPPPELEVSPTAPVGYALAPVAITLTAANGSGVAPYASACLDAGSGEPLCSTTPGPAWTFEPTFPNAGAYTLRAWAVDADGTNVSTSVPVTIVPPLAVGPVGPAGANATVGAPLELDAGVTGGAAPLRYWWNSSAGASPLLAGELASGGTLNLTFVPTVPGPLLVSLTVVDRLGSVVDRDLLVPVGPAAAEKVAATSAPSAGAVTVGAPVSLSWAAFDVSGTIDTTFEAAAELTVREGSVAPEAWVNASGVGSLPPLGDGTYGVPPSAWIDGGLSLTVTLGTAGEASVTLSGSGMPGSVAPTNLTVGADRSHLRLYDPSVARAGGRSNATFWRVEDRFGNPVPGAVLAIEVAFGGTQETVAVAAVPAPGGGSGVWVNYSAPTAGAGEVSVVDAAGAVVLGPLAVPAAVPSSPSPAEVDALATAVPLGAAGVATFAVARRRRRAHRSVPAEEELRELAEGRARTVELLERSGPTDLAGLESAWQPPPVPPALADWIASLVADGTVHATVGDDGQPRFCLADGRATAPQVTVDVQMLDRSLRQRDEELSSEEGDGAERSA